MRLFKKNVNFASSPRSQQASDILNGTLSDFKGIVGNNILNMCNMKRFCFIILFFVFSIGINAQSIGRFLDFHLGQSIYEVQNIVNTKYRGAEWKNNSCEIYNISLAGETFKLLTLYFQNGMLSEACFSYNHTGSMVYGYNNAVRTRNSALQRAGGMISRLYATYASKYGKETVLTDNAVIWNGKNGNSIKISLSEEMVDMGGGNYGLNCAVLVKYSSSYSDIF